MTVTLDMPPDARRAWRAFTSGVSRELLVLLRERLLANSPEVIRGSTTFPVPSLEPPGEPVQAACAVGWLAWKSERLEWANEVEHAFACRCALADEQLGEPAGCRWFTNWFDSTPRAVAFPALAEDIRQQLEGEPCPPT